MMPDKTLDTSGFIFSERLIYNGLLRSSARPGFRSMLSICIIIPFAGYINGYILAFWHVTLPFFAFHFIFRMPGRLTFPAPSIIMNANTGRPPGKEGRSWNLLI